MFQLRSTRECESAALPSSGSGPDLAGLPAAGRLRFSPGPPYHRGDSNGVL